MTQAHTRHDEIRHAKQIRAQAKAEARKRKAERQAAVTEEVQAPKVRLTKRDRKNRRVFNRLFIEISWAAKAKVREDKKEAQRKARQYERDLEWAKKEAHRAIRTNRALQHKWLQSDNKDQIILAEAKRILARRG